jgi:glycosyltransferase involved in cell wall biosynthesis
MGFSSSALSGSRLLRVAVLVDLPRSPLSGGHVKGWEKRAKGAVENDLPVDLTLYFSGPEAEESLGPHVRLRSLPPVFSTRNLKFLPYVPDHTDLALYHPRLARELPSFDVIHTTDGFFNFTRTAERISKKHGLPLTTSLHTATPAYARIFAKKAIEEKIGNGWLGRWLIEDLDFPGRQERKMDARLRRHISLCRHAFIARTEDRVLAESVLGKARVHELQTAIDRALFGPQRRDREGIERDYGIPSGKIVALFVGRMDVGKNIYTLIEAAEKLLREGVPLHILTAGVGPAADDVRARLGAHATVAGFVPPKELGRLYASADLLALTSEVEIRSLVGVEALASGCPVLVSSKSEIAPLFQNTFAMRVVAGKAEGWADALRAFAADEELRKKMRQAASDYGANHFVSWGEEVEKDFLPVWEEAAREARGSKNEGA